MPRSDYRPENEVRSFKARAHRWHQGTERRIAELLGLRRGHCVATIQASNCLGAYKASLKAFASLPRKQGRLPPLARKGAIRQLRLIFATYYVGRKHGRAKNELEFIQLCLEDAELVKAGFMGLRYNLRALRGYALPPAIWRRGPGRQEAIESIADRLDERVDTEEWELPAEPSAYVLRIEDDGDGVQVVWNSPAK
jgi:hypothetical protein